MNSSRCKDIGTVVGCINDVVLQQKQGELATGVSFFNSGGMLSGESFETLSWQELNSQATAMAAALQARGVQRQDHVAVIGNTSKELVTLIQAIWLCGATVVVVPLPYRLSTAAKFVEDTKARLSEAECKFAVLDSLISKVAGKKKLAETGCEVIKLAKLAKEGDADDFTAPEYLPDDLMILQFTSGSTSAPKGVMLHNSQLVSNLDAITIGGGVAPAKDTFVSWLPLHHDMGLIGMLTYSMASGVNLIQASPDDFLGSPSRWMEWISTHQGTITAGPNFSYALAARGLRKAEALDLSSLRIALNGAEPVNPDTVREFASMAEKFGMNPDAVFPAFGMAEVCIAGSFGQPLQGLRVDRVDPEALEQRHYAEPSIEVTGRELVILGKPADGLEFRIVDPHRGELLEERQVGELQISGTSLTPGYYKRPEATSEAFYNGWFKTGDLAYMIDNELVLCGRIKDVIIIGGRNIYPQDIEAEVSELDDVRSGNVIAISTQKGGKEAIAVIAETKLKGDLEELRSEVKAAVIGAVGVPAADVVFVKPSTLPKTSSGKVQRSKAKQQYQQSELTVIS